MRNGYASWAKDSATDKTPVGQIGQQDVQQEVTYKIEEHKGQDEFPSQRFYFFPRLGEFQKSKVL